MAVSLVEGTVKTIDQEPCAGAEVIIRLVSDGYGSGQIAGDGYTVVGSSVIETDEQGDWSVSLQPNDDIFPVGSLYEFRITPKYGEPASKIRLTVPSGGPHRFEDLVASVGFGYGGY